MQSMFALSSHLAGSIGSRKSVENSVIDGAHRECIQINAITKGRIDEIHHQAMIIVSMMPKAHWHFAIIMLMTDID